MNINLEILILLFDDILIKYENRFLYVEIYPSWNALHNNVQ